MTIEGCISIAYAAFYMERKVYLRKSLLCESLFSWYI